MYTEYTGNLKLLGCVANMTLIGVLLTCRISASQDSSPTQTAATISTPDKPQANKKYLSIGGKVHPPVGIQTADPQQEQPKSGRPKFVGTTVLKFGINEEGTVDWVRVVRSSSMRALDDKAVAAVKNWTFQPATKDGLPVAVETNAEVNFKLY